MTCPLCQIDYNQDSWGDCPHCGEDRSMVTSGVMKTSTILIAAGREQHAGIYRSVEEVPEPLRRLLVQSTNGINSGTIFIADQRGKEEISKALRGLPYQSADSEPELPALPAVWPFPRACPPPRAAPGWQSPSALLLGALLAVFVTAIGWFVLARYR